MNMPEVPKPRDNWS